MLYAALSGSTSRPIAKRMAFVAVYALALALMMINLSLGAQGDIKTLFAYGICLSIGLALARMGHRPLGLPDYEIILFTVACSAVFALFSALVLAVANYLTLGTFAIAFHNVVLGHNLLLTLFVTFMTDLYFRQYVRV